MRYVPSLQYQSHPSIFVLLPPHSYIHLISWTHKDMWVSHQTYLLFWTLILGSCFSAIAITLHPNCYSSSLLYRPKAFLDIYVYIPELSASLFGIHLGPLCLNLKYTPSPAWCLLMIPVLGFPIFPRHAGWSDMYKHQLWHLQIG